MRKFDVLLLALQEAEKLQEHCLEKARLARELYTKCVSKRKASSHVSTASVCVLQVYDLFVIIVGEGYCRAAPLPPRSGSGEFIIC